MATEYHKKIMAKAKVEFEDIQDTDVLTWDYFDQGFGIKGWYHLYHQDGRLKDLQCGEPIPVSERLYVRPALKRSKEFLDAEKAREEKAAKKAAKLKERTIKKAAKQSKTLMVINPSVPSSTIKKEKGKRNLSPSERARRAERMRAVAQNYWAQKRKNTNAPS